MAVADSESGRSSLRHEVEARRDEIKAVVARHHGRRVRLFGSAARGDARPDSDIDFLVDFDPESSLYDLIRLTRDLGALLQRRVDVVSVGGLKERDRKVLAEAVDL